MSDVTRILSQIESGDPSAAEQLLPLVYDELRKLAAARLAQEKPGQTLQATALVHEAWLRLVGGGGDREQAAGNREEATRTQDELSVSCHVSPVSFTSRGHFFAAAAEAMRRILIDQARHKQSRKAGGAMERVELADIPVESTEPALDLLALDEALQKLECEHPRKAQLIKLRYFAGLTIEQAAEALGVAPSTASSDWVFAKSWLRLEMRGAE